MGSAGGPGLWRMGTWAALALILALTPAAAAHAADPETAGDNVKLLLSGTISPRCAFLEDDIELRIGADNSASIDLAFTCNLADAAPVTIAIQSARGAMQDREGERTIGYSLRWTAQGADRVANAAQTAKGRPMQVDVPAGGAGTIGRARLTVQSDGEPMAAAAGEYFDEISITVSP